MRDVKAGEELSYDYQFSHFTDKPFQCRCGAPGCRGYLTTQTEADSNVTASINRLLCSSFDDNNVALPSTAANDTESSAKHKSRLQPRSIVDKDEVLFTHEHVAQAPETMLWNSTLTRDELIFARQRKLFRTGLTRNNKIPRITSSANGKTFPNLLVARQRRLLDLYKVAKKHAEEKQDSLLLKVFWVWLDMASRPNLFVTSQQSEQDLNNQVCSKCALSGNLLCCDFCPNAVHLTCVGMTEYEVPDGEWKCHECRRAKNSKNR